MAAFPRVLLLALALAGVAPGAQPPVGPRDLRELAANISRATNSRPVGPHYGDPTRRYGASLYPALRNPPHEGFPVGGARYPGGAPPNRDEFLGARHDENKVDVGHAGSVNASSGQPVVVNTSNRHPVVVTTSSEHPVMTNTSGEHPNGVNTSSEHPEISATGDHAVFVYNGTTGSKDKRVINGKDFVPSQPNRDDLCSFCLCNRDNTEVACLHSHSKSIGTHSLNVSQRLLPAGAKTLLVSGYEQVWVEGGAFASEHLNLLSITFQGIRKLHIQRNSFFFAPIARANKIVAVALHDCGIPRLPSNALTQGIQGRHSARDFLFQRERTRVLALHINKCQIGSIDKDALRQTRVLTLNISETTVGEMAERAIDLDVAELAKFKGNLLPALGPLAVCLHAKSTVFLGNDIRELGNRSVSIETESLVIFQGNRIGALRSGALMGIAPREDTYGSGVSVVSNAVGRTEPGCLALPSAFADQQISILNNTLEDLPCTCEAPAGVRALLREGDAPPADGPSIAVGRTRCRRALNGATPTVAAFLAADCRPFPVATVSAVAAAFLLLVAAVTACVVCSLRVQHAKESAHALGDCPSQSFSTLSPPYDDASLRTPCEAGAPFARLGPWGVAVPEVKTYQQNQTPAFTECAESIRGSRATVGSLPRGSCPFD